MTMHEIKVEMTEEQIRLWAKSRYSARMVPSPFREICQKWVEENPELIPVTTWLTPDEVEVRKQLGPGYSAVGDKFTAECRKVDL